MQNTPTGQFATMELMHTYMHLTFCLFVVVVRQWKANDLYDNADKISIIVQHLLGTNRVAGAHYLDNVTEVVVTEQQLCAHCIDTCIGKHSPVDKPTARNPS